MHMQITPKERLIIARAITVGTGEGGKTVGAEHEESCY